MERWQKLNVYVSVAGFIGAVISIFLAKFSVLFYCLAAFGIGIAYKGFKNIYKNVEPPTVEKVTDPYDYSVKNKKKKKKRK